MLAARKFLYPLEFLIKVTFVRLLIFINLSKSTFVTGLPIYFSVNISERLETFRKLPI